ncbi:MAG: Rossmann-like domain-containing protein [Bacillota bacterium]
MKFIEQVKEEFRTILEEEELLANEIKIAARGLSTEEAIGNPDRDDFPLVEGNEVMIQAEFKDHYGQAFTDHPGNFTGTLQDILDLELTTNYHRALLIAAINAVLRYLGLTDKTVHCKDQEMEECATETVQLIKSKSGVQQVGIIGYQPAIISNLVAELGAERVMVTDINQDKIERDDLAAEVWDGHQYNQQLIVESDFVLCTGSTIINGTFAEIWEELKSYEDKEVRFFGNTISGVAKLMDIPHLCYCGR